MMKAIHKIGFLGICYLLAQMPILTFAQAIQQDSLPQKTTYQARYLVLDRVALSHKRIRYEAGDELHFKLKTNNLWQTGTLVYVGDTTILFAEYSKPIALNQIKAIRTYSNSGIVRQGRLGFLIAALVFFSMDFISAPERNIATLPQRSYITSGTFVGASLLCNIFYQRTYRVNNQNLLRIRVKP